MAGRTGGGCRGLPGLHVQLAARPRPQGAGPRHRGRGRAHPGGGGHCAYRQLRQHAEGDYTILHLDFLVINSRMQEIRGMVDNGARMLTKKLHFQGYDEYCPVNTTLVRNQINYLQRIKIKRYADPGAVLQ